MVEFATAIDSVEDEADRARLDALVDDLKAYKREWYKRERRKYTYLPLGTRVAVRAIATAYYHGDWRIVDRTELPVGASPKGIIVGVRSMQEGAYSSGRRMYGDEDIGGPFLEVRRLRRAYLVAFSLFTKPVHVLIDDVVPVENGKEVSDHA